MTSPKASDPQPETERAHCDRHGEYDQRVTHYDGFTHRSPCPTCTAETIAKREAREAQLKAAARRQRIDDLRDASGIPLRYADRTLDNFHARNPGQRLALNICRRYATEWQAQWNDGRCLVFVGGPGTGKTHLACAIGAELIESFEARVRFTTASAMLREIRSTYSRNSERSEADAVAEFTDCHLLVLDEIGAQLGSEYEKTLMFEVLNERYQQVLPTIIVSNLSAEDLESYLGQRVMDRLRETGVVVAFGWDSHRGKAGA